MNKNFVKRESCPTCGNLKNKLICRIPYNSATIKNYLNLFYSPQGKIELEYLDDANFTLLECTHCSLIYQEEIPNDFLMSKLYEEWLNPNIIFEKFEINKNLDFHIKYCLEIINLINHLNKKPSELSFLDFGMGWGKWCLMAKAFGCAAYGVELSQTRINFAKKNGIEIIDYEKIINFEFDFINTEQVFEHIPNPLEVLKHLTKSLKANGIIKISVPNGYNSKRVLEKMNWDAPKGHEDSLNIVAPLEHINCFKKTTIIKMAQLAGLKFIDVKEFYHFKNVHFANKKYLGTDSFIKSQLTLIKELIRPIYQLFKLKKRDEAVIWESTSLYFIKN